MFKSTDGLDFRVFERCWNNFILGKMTFLAHPVKFYTELLHFKHGSLALAVSSWVYIVPGSGLLGVHQTQRRCHHHSCIL